MRLMTSYTNAEWSEVSPHGEEATTDYTDQFRRSLTEAFRCPNLVILTGLGTSLCIKAPDGQPLAPTMRTLWDTIRDQVTPKVFDDICTHVRHNKLDDSNTGNVEFVADIELLLSKCLISQQFRYARRVRDFIRQAETIIVELCGFVTTNTSLDVHEAFLRRIGRRPTLHPRTKLFTTNYDLAFEMAASRIHFIPVDGFSHSYPQEFDGSHFAYDFVRREDDGSTPTYIPNVFHLYKLHGSVDWQHKGDRIIKRRTPKKPVLIYPRHSKFELSYELPFLDLMSRFQTALRQTETSLVVIGFGFNDKHLSQPILSAIKSNVSLRTLVVSPSLEGSDNSTVTAIENLIAAGDSRLCLVAGTFEEFVPLLPDLVSETEDETHRRRLRGEM